jgi:hypothetical protein
MSCRGSACGVRHPLATTEGSAQRTHTGEGGLQLPRPGHAVNVGGRHLGRRAQLTAAPWVEG